MVDSSHAAHQCAAHAECRRETSHSADLSLRVGVPREPAVLSIRRHGALVVIRRYCMTRSTMASRIRGRNRGLSIRVAEPTCGKSFYERMASTYAV